MEIFRRATSFQDFLDSLDEYQYVSYYITLEDCKNPTVRKYAGRHAWMLDELLKYKDLPYRCPGNMIETLSGIIVTESEWMWRTKNPLDCTHYYQENETLTRLDYVPFQLTDITFYESTSVIVGTTHYTVHTGQFVKDDDVIFFSSDERMCIPTNNIKFIKI